MYSAFLINKGMVELLYIGNRDIIKSVSHPRYTESIHEKHLTRRREMYKEIMITNLQRGNKSCTKSIEK
jgi:hypothetical protein